jgi:hypothetical protein
MNSKAIGVWLTIALLGVILYMLPAVMKQIFFMKEQFVSQMDSGDWKGEVLGPVSGSVSGPEATPSYLQNVPSASKDFEVGGTGGNSLESQPAPVDFGADELTPMQMQGMQMKKAPATQEPVEAFQAGSPNASLSPGTAPGPAPVTSSGSSLAPAPGTAPSAAPSAALVSAPKVADCGYQYNPDPFGLPLYTCDGKIASPPKLTTSQLTIPPWLSSTASKDGIDDDEAAIMSWWLSNDGQALPTWVKDLAKADTLTASEKKAFAGWAKENTKVSGTNLIKPTSGSSDSTSSTSSCKPTCKPKTKCKPKAESKQCKGPVDMGDYVRKDSIPCWACKL